MSSERAVDRLSEAIFGRAGSFWIGIWTLFLIEPVVEAVRLGTPVGWFGAAALVLFAVWYIGAFAWQRRRHRLWGRMSGAAAAVVLGVAIGLSILACLTVGQVATATGVYICVLCVAVLRPPYSLVAGAAVAGGYFAAGFVVPGWGHDSGTLLGSLAALLAIFGVSQVILRNAELRRAHEENARLAVAEERNRFARDLHDILGHSLSVITLKAQLARKLMPTDPEQATAELADLERLSRDALQDVRRAVEGYRDLTIPGELARARIALRAAEIEADLPTAADDVPTELREPFAWAIREGVTNVIRHSGARRCQVRLEADRVSIADDGRGPEDSDAGSGLLGLRERAAAVGATLVTGTSALGGFQLEVIA